MSRSEYRCLALLRMGKGHELSADEVYRAMVAENNAHETESTMRVENNLSLAQQNLLFIRRRIRRGELTVARDILLHLPITKDLSLDGDRLFLLASIAHRQGAPREASQLYSEAAKQYLQAPDDYRALRSLINAEICSGSLANSLSGSLYSLEQEVRRQGYHELAAHCLRMRASELLSAGRGPEALSEAEAAVAFYDLDGDPEDKAIAQYLSAIAQFQSQNAEAAQKTSTKIHLHDGKVKVYAHILESLLKGKNPKTPVGHPLDGVRWLIHSAKGESISGKIIQNLNMNPMTRDQLIAAVWGPEALDPSYCDRLYSAIKFIRKNQRRTILFDGEFYRLLS
jgi:tetratricopeptide (TPR) repeat protein